MKERIDDGPSGCCCCNERKPLLPVEGPCSSGFNRVLLAGCIASLAEGYEGSCISGAILLIKQNLGLSPARAGYVVGTGTGAGVLGTFCAGALVDCIGRKASIVVVFVLSIIGPLCTTLAFNVAMVFVGRLIAGFAIGLSATVVDVYITEACPASKRGCAITSTNICGACGVLLGFLVNYLLVGIQMDHLGFLVNDWRLMLSIGFIFPIVGLTFMCLLPPPESPRYLAMCGKDHAAKEALESIVGKEQAALTMQEDQAKLAPTEASWRDVLWSGSRSRRRALLVTTCMGCATSFAGMAVLGIYISWIVAQEMGTKKAFLFALLCAVMSLAVQLVMISCFVDSCARRRLILLGLIGVTASMVYLAVIVSLGLSFMPWLFAGYGSFVFCGAVGGGATNTLMAEVWDVAARAKGLAASRIPARLILVVILSLYPTIVEWTGLGPLLFFFSFNCLLSVVFVYMFVPETLGVPLERMEEVFK